MSTPLDACISIDHVAIAVNDVNEAVEWYASNLGFQCVERRLTRGEKTEMLSAVLKSGTAVLVLVQGVGPESQVSRFIDQFGPGVQHLALQVTDLDVAIKHFTSAGADIDVIEEEGIRQVFLRRDAGSGVRIELIERRGGSFNDRSVEKLFRSFEAKGLL
jgi:methylmalonyl-CoA/ethylmalonyl-CoA epimerase